MILSVKRDRRAIGVLDFQGIRPGFKLHHYPGFGSVDLPVDVPLWLPLLLLFIIPAFWLPSRPASPPAFPVVTNANQ